MTIEIIDEPISREKMRSFLGNPFPDMIKCVADLKRDKIALGGEMHADAEQVLLKDGAVQSDLWGFNIFPDEAEKIEYSSLINIRPAQGNRSMIIQDEKLCESLYKLIIRFIPV